MSGPVVGVLLVVLIVLGGALQLRGIVRDLHADAEGRRRERRRFLTNTDRRL